jgi:hypothetical protein
MDGVRKGYTLTRLSLHHDYFYKESEVKMEPLRRSGGSEGCRRAMPPKGHRLKSIAPLPPPVKVALPRRRCAPPQVYGGRLSIARRQPSEPQRETHPQTRDDI